WLVLLMLVTHSVPSMQHITRYTILESIWLARLSMRSQWLTMLGEGSQSRAWLAPPTSGLGIVGRPISYSVKPDVGTPPKTDAANLTSFLGRRRGKIQQGFSRLYELLRRDSHVKAIGAHPMGKRQAAPAHH